MTRTFFLVFFLIIASTSIQCARGSELKTRWAEKVNLQKPHQQYPRPQMVRKDWDNLNGLWEYAVAPKDIEKEPAKFQGMICVPFPIESSLSQVTMRVGQKNRLWYRRRFKVPEGWSGKRVRLNFSAVDWETEVWVNDMLIGTHRGGYDSFGFDITDALNNSDSQKLVVAVWDPTNDGTQPRGKQVNKPGGIWYTPVTGIWQTVWLEPVSKTYIKALKIVTDIDSGKVRLSVECSSNVPGYTIEAIAGTRGQIVSQIEGKAGEELILAIDKAILWEPDKPFLYDLSVKLKDNSGKTVDETGSYFGMRKIALGKDESGKVRMMLNNRFVFQLGTLDQGWWPDGLYTAPTDEALRYDIEITKKLGFNMIRKHVKVEPARWYYHCDVIGMLVWQDMPNGDRHISGDERDLNRSLESAEQYELELERMISTHYNHPSIVTWVPFNEGWGQFDTGRIISLVKKLDPTRLVDGPSGWSDRGVGDMHDIHMYPGPGMPETETTRAVVLGEFGGLGLPIKNKTWQKDNNWGYRNYQGSEELQKAYKKLITELQPMIRNGLSAAVYTQTTDVETEVNGLMTYDRGMIKMDPEEVAMINAGQLGPFFEPNVDIFIGRTKLELISINETARIYYTLNGGEPDRTSNLYSQPVKLTDTTTIKAVCFWPDGKKSEITEKTFTKVEPVAAKKPTDPQKGLRYRYYQDQEQAWKKISDFEQAKEIANGITKKIDPGMVRRDQYYGLKFEGYINLPRTGVYTFYISSDDGSVLYVGGKKVVDNDGIHGIQEKHGQIALGAGYHPISVLYFQTYGGKGLKVSFAGPRIDKQELPEKLLFHKAD